MYADEEWPPTATSWAGSSPNPSCGVPFAHSRTRCSLLRKTKDHVRVACDTYRHGTCSTCHPSAGGLAISTCYPFLEIFRLLNHGLCMKCFPHYPLWIMFRLSMQFLFICIFGISSIRFYCSRINSNGNKRKKECGKDTHRTAYRVVQRSSCALRSSQRLTFADAGKASGRYETRAQLDLN